MIPESRGDERAAVKSTSAPLQIWGAHPFVWSIICGFVALVAIVFALAVLRDPHAGARRAFLRQCHEQAYDLGAPDRCAVQAQARFGAFDPLAQDIAYLVAALAVFAGTSFVLLYVMRQVGKAVEGQP